MTEMVIVLMTAGTLERVHGESRKSYMGGGYEVQSAAFTACFDEFIGVPNARLDGFCMRYHAFLSLFNDSKV